MVLIDTSFFIDYFRGQDDNKFEQVILDNTCVLSFIVKLEHIQGVRKSEIKNA